jgi:hypothetical protein
MFEPGGVIGIGEVDTTDGVSPEGFRRKLLNPLLFYSASEVDTSPTRSSAELDWLC